MDFIGLIVALVVGAAVTIPIIALIALVRANGTRRQLEEYAYKLVDLRGEILDLRGELRKVAERVDRLESGGVAATQTVDRSARETAAQVTVSAAIVEKPVKAREDIAAAIVTEVSSEQVTTARVEAAVAGVAMFKAPAVPPADAVTDDSATTRLAEQAAKKDIKPEEAPQNVPSRAEAPASFNVPYGPTEAVPLLQSDPKASFSAASEVAEHERAVPVEAQTPMFEPVVRAASAEEPARPFVPAAPPLFANVDAGPPRKAWAERLRTTLPLEELLGMNLFAKLGIVLLVLGFAFLGRMAMVAMGPGARDAVIYGIAAAMLGGGIWLENRERYRIVGRAGIGGGWALLFFTTYALNHVAPMRVMNSITLDCILMLAIAVAMVVHTLRYKSQVVTGLAFLLAFSTVALSQDSVYSLAAGVILALGIVAIALKMNWFELEAFGILASYGNHFYWLYKLYPDGVAGHAFPQFWASALILILYWAIFRFSYIVRRIEMPRQESISTVAAILNVMLLGAEMKYQSTHPELAFYALLAMGAVEFLCGQLPVTKRRRAAFTLLTVIGTLLIFAAVPFKFSGNNIALFWMIAAEALLIAGIVQLEKLFRWLGLLSAVITGLLVVYESWGLVTLRQSSEVPMVKDGVLLLMCSLLFYVNSQYVARRWKELFAQLDRGLALAQSVLGCVTAFLGVWAIFTADWTAIGWGALLLGTAFGAKHLKGRQLLVQAWVLALAAIVRAGLFNLHFDQQHPHHLGMRLVTVPILAALFYVAAWTLRGVKDFPLSLNTVAMWTGSALLAVLAWVEMPQAWMALAWVGFALVLCLIGRRFKLAELVYQEHVLAVAAVWQLAAFNLWTVNRVERSLPMAGCAVAFYAISQFCTQKDAAYRRPAAWLHRWTATALLATVVWLEMPQGWVAPAWVGLAIAACLIGRRFRLADLVYQEHPLAVAAAAQLAAFNLYAQSAVDRYVPLILCAAAFYAVSRFCTRKDAGYRRPAAWLHTWAATGLLAALAWHEAEQPWLAVMWVGFALALAVCDRIFDVEELPWQAHVLALMAVARVVAVNFFIDGAWRGLHLRLITIGLVIAVLYLLARWVRMPDAAKKLEMPHAYTWVAAGLTSWLLWKELQPISLALGLGVFGLVLFEIGEWKNQRQLCWQAYVLMAASFVRIFFVNLTAATLPGETLSPRIYTVAPLALIYFYVWTRLEGKKTAAETARWSAGSLIAYFGSASIAALLYFEVSPEWIIVAWAVMALALITTALALDKEVFAQQAILVVVWIAGRGLAHNIFGSSYFVAGGWRGKFSVLSFTSLLLLSALPVAFKIRARCAERKQLQWLSRWLFVHRPEQIFFFVPVGLIVLTIEAKMNPGMVTLSWGVVGLMVIVLGLLTGERSYRLTGLVLLLLCVGKIVIRDAWRLEERDRYITFIVLGAALFLVSMLYSRYRDQLKRLL
jgi:hypothetical protein